MDITITDETETTLEFELEDATVELANALRRTMIGGIPTLAVEDVTVSRNNSGLFDEILAHRLGMTPWEFDREQHELPAECDCEDGCPQCEVSMALQVDGPATVTADDISVPAEDVAPANPDTVIAELQDDGEIDVEMTAQLGAGQDHAKWQAANASYSYEDDTFHIEVESVSGLDPRTIVHQAVEQLEERLDAFEDAVDGSL
ncbi:MAG: DNA-directed RNA polymerase subunit D [Candidatus Nanohaloarchaea archaeon]|nr:DNA-directed RNA polymerase subunit D [Candidatus Nanohaloarchaea archaeon]